MERWKVSCVVKIRRRGFDNFVGEFFGKADKFSDGGNFISSLRDFFGKIFNFKFRDEKIFSVVVENSNGFQKKITRRNFAPRNFKRRSFDANFRHGSNG